MKPNDQDSGNGILLIGVEAKEDIEIVGEIEKATTVGVRAADWMPLEHPSATSGSGRLFGVTNSCFTSSHLEPCLAEY